MLRAVESAHLAFLLEIRPGPLCAAAQLRLAAAGLGLTAARTALYVTFKLRRKLHTTYPAV